MRCGSSCRNRSDNVIGAKFLSNFGIDDENSKLTGSQGSQGVIVSLKPGIQSLLQILGSIQTLNQCRALFDGGAFTNVSTLVRRTVVLECTLCRKLTLLVIWSANRTQLWISMCTMLIRSQKLERKDRRGGVQYEPADRTLEEAQAYRAAAGWSEQIRADFTNILYRGRGEYHFYNNGYKEAGLVLLSPLTGYRVVDATGSCCGLSFSGAHRRWVTQP